MLGLLRRARREAKDVRRYGWAVTARHRWKTSRPDHLCHLEIAGIGPVVIRAGDSDMEVVRQVFEQGDYDLWSMPAVGARLDARYHAILKAGGKPIIVDAGANIGMTSLWLASRYPEARIVAVEPDPGNAEMIRRNVRGRPNLMVLEAAIGAEPGHVALINPGHSFGIQTSRSDHGVPVVTVEDCFAHSGGDTPFIVKVDIEGFERDLFSANTQWIGRCAAVFVEPHDWMFPGEYSSRAFQEQMAQHPFELFIRGDNLLYVR